MLRLVLSLKRQRSCGNTLVKLVVYHLNLSKNYHVMRALEDVYLYYTKFTEAMIDSFKVKADIPSNKLVMQLRGFFMKSEVELAFYLARKEIKKLEEGFVVILDLDGMHTDKNIHRSIQVKAKRIFTTLGASKIKSVGAIAKMIQPKVTDLEYFAFDSVGLYPN